MRSGIASEILSLTLRSRSSAWDFRSSGANPFRRRWRPPDSAIEPAGARRRQTRQAFDHSQISPRPIPNGRYPSVPRGRRPHQNGRRTDIVDTRCGETLHRKGDFAAAAPSAFIQIRYRPSDHGLNHFSFRKLFGRPLVDEPPVTQHRDAVAESQTSRIRCEM